MHEIPIATVECSVHVLECVIPIATVECSVHVLECVNADMSMLSCLV